MEQTRGILFLTDPLRADGIQAVKSNNTEWMTLVFDENGRYLSLAQEALHRLRCRCSWVCVAAEGGAGCIALALAAQLPVDRLALSNSSLFFSGRKRMPRELLRLEAYVRRNLSLVVSEILLIGAAEAEVKGLLRGTRHSRICLLEEAENCWEEYRNILAAPWGQACRNNLLIPWKCV